MITIKTVDDNKGILERAKENEFNWFQKRYSTEEEARISHENIVKAFERGEIK